MVKEERENILAGNSNNKLGLLFVENSDYSDKTKDITKWLFDKIITKNQLNGIDDLLTAIDYDSLETIFLNLKPDSVRSIGNYFSILSRYSKWCYEQGYVPTDNLSKMLEITDKSLLWQKCKANKQKYFNHKTYLEIIDEIEKYEDFNSSQYITLFMSLYEGIYSKNLLALINLRTGDIKDGFAHFIVDSTERKIKITSDLEERLYGLANCEVWYRKSVRGTISRIKIHGKYDDSIFKVERRIRRSNSVGENIDESIQHILYRRLRKVNKEYLGDNSNIPLQIYLSGIMYRICEELKANDIPVSVAFDEKNRNSKVHNIIQNELDKSYYGITTSSFRYQMKEYIPLFL